MSSFISRRTWAVFAVIVAADVLNLLSTTVAAPAILRDLHAADPLAPWLGAGYTLAMGSLLIIGGRFGYRRLFLLGPVGFTLCSLLLTLVTTGACAASLPLLPSRGADLH